jgi:ankyrin repeat protein
MIVSEVFMLQYDETALHHAATGGEVEAVKALVDCGAAVDIRNEV